MSSFCVDCCFCCCCNILGDCPNNCYCNCCSNFSCCTVDTCYKPYRFFVCGVCGVISVPILVCEVVGVVILFFSICSEKHTTHYDDTLFGGFINKSEGVNKKIYNECKWVLNSCKGEAGNETETETETQSLTRFGFTTEAFFGDHFCKKSSSHISVAPQLQPSSLPNEPEYIYVYYETQLPEYQVENSAFVCTIAPPPEYEDSISLPPYSENDI